MNNDPKTQMNQQDKPAEPKKEETKEEVPAQKPPHFVLVVHDAIMNSASDIIKE